MDRDMVELMVGLDNETARALDEIVSLLADGEARRLARAARIDVDRIVGPFWL